MNIREGSFALASGPFFRCWIDLFHQIVFFYIPTMKIRFNTKKSGQLHYGKATMVDIRDDEFDVSDRRGDGDCV